jgi:hypothetical protein
VTRSGSAGPLGPWLALSAWTLASVAAAHLILFRLVFGVPLRDPHAPPADDFVEGLLSAALVLAVVSGVCGRSASLARALAGATWAAALVEAYFILYDWLRAGWGGEVGHDVFFGESFYWTNCLVAFAFMAACFSIGAAVVLATRRLMQRRELRT